MRRFEDINVNLALYRFPAFRIVDNEIVSIIRRAVIFKGIFIRISFHARFDIAVLIADRFAFFIRITERKTSVACGIAQRYHAGRVHNRKVKCSLGGIKLCSRAIAHFRRCCQPYILRSLRSNICYGKFVRLYISIIIINDFYNFAICIRSIISRGSQVAFNTPIRNIRGRIAVCIFAGDRYISP